MLTPRVLGPFVRAIILTSFNSFTHGRKAYVHFRLFWKEFEFEFSHFNELMDFSSSCMLEKKDMKIFSRVKFCDEISRKSTRIRFSDIHNPTLRFMHRWIAFTLFLTWELRSITIAEFRCLYVMVRKIRYSLVANIVDYFKEIHTLTRLIECTFMVTRIALDFGCP
jgi:hypothetical protein